MSHSMDEIDKEFINALYPEYLLKQPIGYELRSEYYRHKKLFHLTNHHKLNQQHIMNKAIVENGKQVQNSNFISSSNVKKNSFFVNKLSPSTKKEIWQKLMKLGVLGTMSYDSASEEHIVQVYKYFYPSTNAFLPNELEVMEHDNVSHGKQRSKDSQATSSGTGSSESEQENLNQNPFFQEDPEDYGPPMRNPWTSDDISSLEGYLLSDNDTNLSAQRRRNLEAGRDVSDNRTSTGTDITYLNGVEYRAEREKSPEKKDGNADAFYYSNFGSPKVPYKMKTNNISSNVYNTIGYPLPTRWITQADNSVLLSNDGISRLSPNPNWKSYMKAEGSDNGLLNSVSIGPQGAYGRNRLRSSGIQSGNQKYEYATTWANHPVSLSNLGIFYFEIRVLNVSSSQGGRNSNILIGYKLRPNGMMDEIESKNMDNALMNNSMSSVHFMEGSHRGSRGLISGGIPMEFPGEGDDNHDLTNELEPTIDANDGGDEFDESTTIGLSTVEANKVPMRGFCGYSGYDGKISNDKEAIDYNKPYGRDDVIGCGVNFVDGTIFYTKNGVYLGSAFHSLFNSELIPAIALRPGNSVRTNFGLYEEYVFDIVGYQDKWKAKTYNHIFKSLDNSVSCKQTDTSNDPYSDNDISLDDDDDAAEDDDDNTDIPSDDDISMKNDKIDQMEKELPFLLGKDKRLFDGKLSRPPVKKINKLSSEDDSIPSMLNVLINDYLIHEGLIDVAKGFSKDLRKDCTTLGSDMQDGAEVNAELIGEETDYGMDVIRYNERQIVNEENMLKMRYEIRSMINQGAITKCIDYLNEELPNLLIENYQLLFELKLCEFLMMIVNKNDKIEDILLCGQELSKTFVNNEKFPLEQRDKFNMVVNNVSGLLAYDDPINEAPEDISCYLTNKFLQDRLFQLINSGVLKFLNKDSECALDNIIGYTRSMISTFMKYEKPGHGQNRKDTNKYYKLINIDEDLLNL